MQHKNLHHYSSDLLEFQYHETIRKCLFLKNENTFSLPSLNILDKITLSSFFTY